MLIGLLFIGGISGGIVFGFLSALEWVYRGFRPLPPSPTAERIKEDAVEMSPTPTSRQAQIPALPSPAEHNTIAEELQQKDPAR